MLLSLAEVAPHSLVESVDITQSGVTPTFMHICVLLASPTCLLYKMEMVGQRASTVARAINRECMCDVVQFRQIVYIKSFKCKVKSLERQRFSLIKQIVFIVYNSNYDVQPGK